MPCYDLKCSCGHIDEYIFSIYEDLETNTICSSCGKHINRKENRTYSSADAPTIVGATSVVHQKKAVSKTKKKTTKKKATKKKTQKKKKPKKKN